MKTLHLISGYPRSGSTLLTALLNQNPRFYSDITDPLFSCVRALYHATQADDTNRHMIDENRRRQLIIDLVRSYHRDVLHKCNAYALYNQATVFNTNRAWTAWLPLMIECFPDVRVLCCVRSLVNVVNSFEHLYQAQPMLRSKIYPIGMDNVYKRTNSLMEHDRPVGLGHYSLKEGLASVCANKIMLVDYMTLCQQPHATMQQVHDFIGEPMFNYDFHHVMALHSAYDAVLDAPGLHDVRKVVEYQPQLMLLPDDIQVYLSNLNLPIYASPAPAHAPILPAGNPQPAVTDKSLMLPGQSQFSQETK